MLDPWFSVGRHEYYGCLIIAYLIEHVLGYFDLASVGQSSISAQGSLQPAGRPGPHGLFIIRLKSLNFVLSRDMS